MASTSTVPRVNVTATHGGGFVVTCTACPDLHETRAMRIDADIAATSHVRSHGRPHPADEDHR